MNTGTGETIPGDFVEDDDPSHYCNPQEPGIDIEKATNGVDADDPNAGDAPLVAPGSTVTWSYKVTNTGNVRLDPVVVTDDQGVAVSCPLTALDPGQMMTCTASGPAEDLLNTPFTTVPGLCGGLPNTPLYENQGKATGETVTGDFVEDEDPSHYCNPPEDDGGEGCTPGYWKQSQHFHAWVGYTPPGPNYEDVFGVDASFNKTLLGALQQGGGGEKALGRHAVAALLNSTNSNVSFAFTTDEVIQIVQDAYASGDFQWAKNQLAAENEQGCPLNNSSRMPERPNRIVRPNQLLGSEDSAPHQNLMLK